MTKPFDATLNSLITAFESSWGEFLAAYLGLPPGPVSSLDTDLSATLQADQLFKIGGSQPGIIHLELESSSRLGIPARLHRYNVNASYRYELPVSSVLMLLRRSAQASDQTGTLEMPGATRQTELWFKYHVVRLWEAKVDDLLRAGVGLGPLVLLTDEAAVDLPTTLHRLLDRLQSESVSDNVKQDVLSSTFVLCGLRYSRNELIDLYRDLAMTLEDSTTYQYILEKGENKGIREGIKVGRKEGELSGLRSACIRIGTKRLGPPPAAFAAAMDQINDIERIERMIDRALDATSWENLLETT